MPDTSVTETEQQPKHPLVRLECPRCGEIGGAINLDSSTVLDIAEHDTLRCCYTGNTVVLHV